MKERLFWIICLGLISSYYFADSTQKNSTVPESSPDEPAAILSSPILGLEIWQDGSKVGMAKIGPRDLKVSVKPREPFEMRVPHDRIQVCVWINDSIFKAILDPESTPVDWIEPELFSPELFCGSTPAAMGDNPTYLVLGVQNYLDYDPDEGRWSKLNKSTNNMYSYLVTHFEYCQIKSYITKNTKMFMAVWADKNETSSIEDEELEFFVLDGLAFDGRGLQPRP